MDWERSTGGGGRVNLPPPDYFPDLKSTTPTDASSGLENLWFYRGWSLKGAGLEQGTSVGLIPWSPPSKATVCSRGADLCCLDTSCNSRKFPATTRRLATYRRVAGGLRQTYQSSIFNYVEKASRLCRAGVKSTTTERVWCTVHPRRPG